MNLRISGKDFQLGEALQTHINRRVTEMAEKFYAGLVNGSVVMSHEGYGYRTDATLHLSSGITLHVEGFAQEPYQSFDTAADRLEGRLRRYKHRLKDHHSGNGQHRVATSRTLNVAPLIEPEVEPATTVDPAIVAEIQVPLKTLSVSNAVIELDFTGAPVLMFQHATSNRVNLVYRRTDGHVGWIDPHAEGERIHQRG